MRFYTTNLSSSLLNSLNLDYTGLYCNYALYSYFIQSNLATSANSLFTNLQTGGTLTIGNVSASNTINGLTNTINGSTTINGNTTTGSSNSISSNFFYFQSASGVKNLFTTATTATINFASSTST